MSLSLFPVIYANAGSEIKINMSMLQHHLLGALIMVGLWHLLLKRHFYTQKNLDDIKTEMDKWFRHFKH
ncbi:MAG TPA: hypothetical protein VJJ83_00715 [Candidatus Babeliales bacterium]|nr:hypothetical protein [Candidatus Babeliales bacterium]